MNYEKTLDEVEDILMNLIEENKDTPILVEGNKDIAALRSLGLTGVIIRINSGRTLSDFCDDIASKYESIILLTDWDRKGGILSTTIKRNLKGRVKCNIQYRKMLASNMTVRNVEGIPSWIKTLKEKSNRHKSKTV